MKKILLPHQFYYPYLDIIKEISSPERLQEYDLSLEEETPRKGMIYVHVPFCNSECTFCGFDKSYNLPDLGGYFDTLRSEIDYYSAKPYTRNLQLTGIHIGGGTPTLLSADMLGDLVDHIRGAFNAGVAPLHIECSAVTLDDAKIEMLRKKRISRVSMGVQTFDPALRRHLNILSSLDQTYDALSRLKRAGIITFIDIMYGFPDLGVGDCLRIALSDVQKAVSFGVEGVDLSHYYPFHNPLEHRVAKEGLRFPSSDDLVSTIMAATSVLEGAGYTQATEYIFYRQGKAILEYAYFGGSDCLALGSGALGLLNGYKYMNKKTAKYMKSDVPGILSLRKLTSDEMERIPVVGFPRLLSLRKDMLSGHLEAKYRDKLNFLIDLGMLQETAESFDLTHKGKAYINNIYFMLMEDVEQKEVERRLKIIRFE